MTGEPQSRSLFSFLKVRREGWMGEIDSGWTKFHVYHCERKNVSPLTSKAGDYSTWSIVHVDFYVILPNLSRF